MKPNKLLLGIFFLLCCHLSFAQNFSKPAKDAFLITRMANKFHLQPPPLNDTFSMHVFSGVLEQLDGDKIYFTANDMKVLEKYRTNLMMK